MSSDFRISYLSKSTILVMYNHRDEIQIDPEYQRQSDIWGLDKRQLLVDSVINGYDIPKIYFHEFYPAKIVNGRKYRYAIIDGKQRLNALWDFIDGEFALSDGFEYYKDPSVKLAGMTYAKLSQAYPEIKSDFDATALNVITIQTTDWEQIEEMFSRLNEAVPLNAAEKRNAFGGPVPGAVRKMISHPFFSKCLPFSNTRYRHLDLATKFLYLEDKEGPTDTKKAYLDHFFKSHKAKPKRVQALSSSVSVILQHLVRTFTDKDPLLKSVGMVATFYLLFREFHEEGKTDGLKRIKFSKFDRLRAENRVLAEQDVTKANWELLEFDRLMQSPNDTVAMQHRLKVLREFIADPEKYSLNKKVVTDK